MESIISALINKKLINHSIMLINAILKSGSGIYRRTLFQYGILVILPLLCLMPNFLSISSTLTFISIFISVVASAFMLIVAVVIPNKQKSVLKPFDYIVLSLIFYLAIRYVLQKDFYLFNDKFVLLSALFLYYLLLRIVKPEQKIIYNSLIFVYIVNILLAIVFHLGLKTSMPFWIQENSNIFAIYIASFIPMIFSKIMDKDLNCRYRYVFGIMAFIGVVLIIDLNSRTSWIAFIAGIMFYLLCTSRRYIQAKRKNWLLFASLFVLSILTCCLYFYKKNSSDGRLFIYRNTIEMIKDKPIFGHGFDSFKTKYLDYQAEYFSIHKFDKQNIYLADNTRTAFNDYLLILSEQGVIAFLLLIAGIYIILKNYTKTNCLYISCLIVLLVASLFSYPFYMAPTGINIVVFSAVVINNSQKQSNTVGHCYRIPAIVVSIVLLIISFFNITLYSKWNNAYSKILTLDLSGFNDYNKLYPYMYKNGAYMYNYGSELISFGYYQSGARILEATKNYFNDNLLYLSLGNAYNFLENYDKAESNYLYCINLVPNRFYPRYALMKLYDKYNLIQKRDEMAKCIVNMEIKVPSKTVDMIRSCAEKTLQK